MSSRASDAARERWAKVREAKKLASQDAIPGAVEAEAVVAVAETVVAKPRRSSAASMTATEMRDWLRKRAGWPAAKKDN